MQCSLPFLLWKEVAPRTVTNIVFTKDDVDPYIPADTHESLEMLMVVTVVGGVLFRKSPQELGEFQITTPVTEDVDLESALEIGSSPGIPQSISPQVLTCHPKCQRGQFLLHHSSL